MGGYLSQLETVIHLVLEWSHLYLANKFGLDLRVAEYHRKQLAEVGKENIHLVVDGRIERCQCEAVIAQIAFMEHVDQKWHDQGSQYVVKRVA